MRRSFEALINGAEVRDAAAAGPMPPATLARYLGVGAPYDMPGIAPARMPLVLAVIRRKKGAPADAPMDDGELLFTLKLIEKDFTRIMSKLTAVTSLLGGDVEVR